MNNEHSAMLSCRCREEDRLTFVCLTCGKVHLFDPSWVIVGLGAVLIVANLVWWARL